MAARTKRIAFPSTRRLVMFGYLSPFFLCLATMTARYISGGETFRHFVCDFVLTTVTCAFSLYCLVRVHLRGVRRRYSLVRKIVVTLVLCVVLCVWMGLLRYGIRITFPVLIPLDGPETVALVLATALPGAVGLLMIWGAIFIFPLTLLRAQRQRVQVAVARRDAESLRLRAYLEPHFVLNTLNTIAGLVVDDPVESRRMIGLLGDLFRDATRDRDDDVHSLADEIAWLERYAAIHESRHRRMVRFVWAIDHDAEAALIPRLVLQPLVENAVLHGALRRREGGTVSVSARLENAHLVCDVEDDGPGFGPGPRRSGAEGLRIVERRLKLFSRAASLTIARVEGATRVTACLPLEEARS